MPVCKLLQFDMIKSVHRSRTTASRGLQLTVLVLAALFLLQVLKLLARDDGSFHNWNAGQLPENRHDGGIEHSPKTLSSFPIPGKDGNDTLMALAPPFIKEIMNPEDTLLPRLECPRMDGNRYQYLNELRKAGSTSGKQYYFALNLHQNLVLLPRLIGSIVEVIQFLGPAKCTLTIVEGGSDDGTYEILHLLRKSLPKDLTYWMTSSDINSREGNRVAKLAQLRNLALEPLLQTATPYDQTVIFLNDVAICPDDILELVHQLVHQEADMTCAMDWTYVGQDPTFYDIWIARGMTGDSFFEIPPDGNWNSAWNLFWNDDATRQRLNSHKPFQVFSCWNGAVAFRAEVLEKIRFRSPRKGECPGGEPTMFCTDLWTQGYGRIAVVPAVNLCYDDEHGRQIKGLKGYVAGLVDESGDDKIVWGEKPPEKVKCIPSYDRQEWLPWDQGV